MNIFILILLIILVSLLLAYLVYSCISIMRSDIEKRRTKKLESKEGILLKNMENS
jgi:membrane protein implicated in regulation of membrane protease activity